MSIADVLRRTVRTRTRHQPDWRTVVAAYLANPAGYWPSDAPRHADRLTARKQALQQRDGLTNADIIEAVVSMAGKRRGHRPAPVYVTGLGGSGSHWVAGMLDDLGGLVAAGEVYFPPRLLEQLRDHDVADQACAADAVHLVHGWPRSTDVWAASMINCAAGVRKLPLYKRWDPRAIVIYLVRDPRDQVLSVTFRRMGLHRYEDPHASDADYLLHMAQRNARSFHQSREVADHIDLTCRYEDLCNDPRPLLRDVLRMLGRPADESAVERSAVMHDAATIRAGKGAAIPNLDEGGQAATWRTTADPARRRALHIHLVDVIHDLGYEPGECMATPLPEHALGARTLHFPQRPPGPLYQRTDGVWTRLETTAVPAGAPALLRIGVGGDLQALEHCKGDDIQALCMAANPDVDDDALRHLSGLTGLRTLDLARTSITDAGLKHLEPLVGLQQLQLAQTGTTAEGRARLAAQLSQLTIWV